MKIEQLEEVDSKCGERQRQLKQSMKDLKINSAKYHGGDFEGNAVQETLNCARDETFFSIKMHI